MHLSVASGKLRWGCDAFLAGPRYSPYLLGWNIQAWYIIAAAMVGVRKPSYLLLGHLSPLMPMISAPTTAGSEVACQ